MAALASPFWLPTKACCESSSPSPSHLAIVALETLALSPSSQTIGSASSAVLACHQVSATTATALSLTLTTFLTPFMPVTLASSKLFSLPPNTGQSLIAALSIPGSLTSAGGSSLAAASTTLPYVVLRPDGVWVMTLLAAVHSEVGTFQSFAAAWISITRAVAPPLRTYSCEDLMPRLPPVEKSPHARLRATFWPGVGYSVVTFDQSHSSSSATSWASPVSVP